VLDIHKERKMQNAKTRGLPGVGWLFGLASLMAWCPDSEAQNLLTNGSFENTDNTFVNNGQGFHNLFPGATTIPGWTVTNDNLAWLNNTNTANVMTPTGSFFLDLTGADDTAPYGGVTQTIATNPGTIYTLSLSLGSSNPTFGGEKTVSVTAGSASTTFTLPASMGPGDLWGPFSFDFTASAASTAITITGTGAGTGSQYIGLDNVSVVPEPAALSALAGMGFALARRRKR
jgi:hypothetical protein